MPKVLITEPVLAGVAVGVTPLIASGAAGAAVAAAVAVAAVAAVLLDGPVTAAVAADAAADADAAPLDGPVAFADLHIHSLDAESSSGRDAFLAAIRASGLSVSVMADHDRIDVALELVARSREEGSPVELIVGEEVTTRGGHLVGVDLKTRVPRGLSLREAVAAVHEQGGLAVVAHPLLPVWFSASEETLIELAEGDPRSRPDAIETMHPLAAWWPGWRRRVEALARRCDYAMVGGSDAHVSYAVGRGRTGFRGSSAADLFAAMRARETFAEGQRAPFSDFFRVDRGRGR